MAMQEAMTAAASVLADTSLVTEGTDDGKAGERMAELSSVPAVAVSSLAAEPPSTIFGGSDNDPTIGKPQAGLLDPAEPVSRGSWLDALSQSRNLVELGILLAWGLKNKWLFLGNSRAGPSQVPCKGNLFPLPVEIPEWLPNVSQFGTLKNALNLGVECWLCVSCAALNATYGLAGQGQTRKRGKVHRVALGHCPIGLRDC